ncbi:hypothetical protein ACIRD3_11945 [Kitasatospora sp. NPDC093550]|uniref:hypothetical protein n=1 Tax=Kitasatospora sp. NPDC093550 TaxID=3364089 RepID=UPI00382CB844
MRGRAGTPRASPCAGGGSLGGLSSVLLTGWPGARGALTVAAAGSAAVIGLLLSPVARLLSLPTGP